MRWSTYLSPADDAEHAGLLHGSNIHGLREPASLAALIAGGAPRLAEAGTEALRDPLEVAPAAEARLLAPVPRPPSIRDFMAFEEHVRNGSGDPSRPANPVWYEIPLFYFTNPAAVRGPADEVPVAPGSQRFDYELEIAAVIGTGGSDLDPASAEEHIAGHTVMCDWSARDLQGQEMRGRLGPAKGKDTATSFSGFLVTPDELGPSAAETPIS